MKFVLPIMIFFVLLSTAYALEFDAAFYIVGDNIVVDYNIKNVSEPFVLNLPEDSRAIELNGESASRNLIIDSNSKLTYIFNSALKKSDKGYFLFDFFAPVKIDNLTISLWLPEGAWLDVAYPKSYETKTDGKNIIIKWNFFVDENEDVPIFVIFMEKRFDFALVAIFIIIVLLCGFILLKFRKNKSQTGYLLEDEKKIVELLSKAHRKTMKQKEIWRETGWSKAKVSRTIRRLQERGIIEVKPHGNTNLVTLKK